VTRPDGPRPVERVVLAHGFTQTHRSWERLTALMIERRPELVSVAVDLPGHGDASDLRGDLWGAADHLVDRGNAGTYVGYSMGGRVALHAALAHPAAVRRLVLIGATAGIDSDDERAERRRTDEQLADEIERRGVDVFIDAWLRNPLFAGLDDETAMRSDRLRNTAAGLAASLRTTGTGTQTPLWDRLGEVRCPTLVLVGELDPKFTELGRRLTASIPDATMVVIAEAGHSVHLEQPERTADAICAFLPHADA
jgi:2-succinyl-6-hydroxy-2,4-cyclohexadiene-1-carboxylate synthase